VDPGWFKTGSCSARLYLELSAIVPDGMEDEGPFTSDGELRFLADAFGELAAQAIVRRTSPDNGQQNVRASKK